MNEAAFELFLGHFGNGITACNKAVTTHGDFEKIAHISVCGKITWYVEPINIPGDSLLKIEHHADVMRVNFERELDTMSKSERYLYLLEMVPDMAFLHAQQMNADITEKIMYLRNVLYQKSTF